MCSPRPPNRPSRGTCPPLVRTDTLASSAAISRDTCQCADILSVASARALRAHLPFPIVITFRKSARRSGRLSVCPVLPGNGAVQSSAGSPPSGTGLRVSPHNSRRLLTCDRCRLSPCLDPTSKPVAVSADTCAMLGALGSVPAAGSSRPQIDNS
jgi:hypothetical protein